MSTDKHHDAQAAADRSEWYRSIICFRDSPATISLSVFSEASHKANLNIRVHLLHEPGIGVSCRVISNHTGEQEDDKYEPPVWLSETATEVRDIVGEAVTVSPRQDEVMRQKNLCHLEAHRPRLHRSRDSRYRREEEGRGKKKEVGRRARSGYDASSLNGCSAFGAANWRGRGEKRVNRVTCSEYTTLCMRPFGGRPNFCTPG